MLVISGAITFRADRIEEARQAALAMMAQSAAEPGCRTYEFSTLLADPLTFRLFEVWDDLQALNAHFQTPHFAAFSASLADLVAAHPVILRYEIAEVAPLL